MNRTFFILLAALLCHSPSSAIQIKTKPKQATSTQAPTTSFLSNLVELLGKNMFLAQLTWKGESLGVTEAMASRILVLRALQNELDGTATGDPIDPSLLDMARQHRKPIESLVNSVDRFPGDEFSQVVFFRLGGLAVGNPVGFAKFKDKACVILSLGSSTVFNSLRLSDSERANQAILRMILPLLEKFEPLMAVPELDYFGISVTYGQRNFVDPTSDPNPESVCLLWSKLDYRSYKLGELSRQEFLRRSAVFMRLNMKSVERIEVG